MELAISSVGQDLNEYEWSRGIPLRSYLHTFIRVIWFVGIPDSTITTSLGVVVMVVYISLVVLTLVFIRFAPVLRALRIRSFNRVC